MCEVVIGCRAAAIVGLCAIPTGAKTSSYFIKSVCDSEWLRQSKASSTPRARRQERTLYKSSLRGGESYTRGSQIAALAPFQHSQVSVPDSVADAPYVDELAPAEVAQRLKG